MTALKNGFTLRGKDPASAARWGTLHTGHGDLPTPIFMPVGTQGTVKSCSPDQLLSQGVRILLGNTYHLHVRPGSEMIERRGGLHAFMRWDRPILTDSGGFQIFSLAKTRKLSDAGVEFQSHLDGRKIVLTPEEAVAVQDRLGSDILMVLDECPPYPSSEADSRQALERTVAWARRCRKAWEERGMPVRGRQLFAIVQGAHYPEQRVECAQRLVEMDFPGYAIGGVSVGEPEPEMLAQVGAVTPHLPESKARYAMGLGTPPQILKMIRLGVDMFDCVMPTRLARHGSVFTPEGLLNLRHERYAEDDRPLVENFPGPGGEFSRSYLRHLLVAGEMLGGTLLSLHNIRFFLELTAVARQHIRAGDFVSWSEKWIARYEKGAISKQ
ncbi:MAG: tRNA guanosine(34) transglycosylase Tgt [Opitutales bacterium]|nr:tRNA guanosine(34) transglycosylase Tgt [Opitutales bacterium]MCH8540859.1 tRNA guanosine(34) transglycosylase Tgt [Opitutales bacterium]